MKQSEKKAWIQTMYLGELIPLLIGTGISVLGYSVAVSYTHLDVYKRQRYTWI